MDEPIGVAVIGAGGIADSHLYSYQRLGERVRRVAVVDESRAARAAERFEFDEALTSYQDVLARDDVQAVSICTPPFLHVEMSTAALRAGKHVLCEKPAAATLAGLDEIEAAAQESGRIFSGVFQLRFGRGAQQLRMLADEGKFGRFHLCLAETMWYRADAYYDDVAWRGRWDTEAGGATVSQAVHIIAMPGQLMDDGQDPNLFDHFAAVAQRAKVYTVQDYAGIIRHLVAVWKVPTLALSGKAAAAQEFLCKQAERLESLAEMVTEEVARQEPAKFSWIHGRRA